MCTFTEEFLQVMGFGSIWSCVKMEIVTYVKSSLGEI